MFDVVFFSLVLGELFNKMIWPSSCTLYKVNARQIGRFDRRRKHFFFSKAAGRKAQGVEPCASEVLFDRTNEIPQSSVICHLVAFIFD